MWIKLNSVAENVETLTSLERHLPAFFLLLLRHDVHGFLVGKNGKSDGFC